MIATSAPPAPAGEFLDTRQVEQFAKLSYATLRRRHKEGHDTGLRRCGRRVLFHKPTLLVYLLSSCDFRPRPEGGTGWLHPIA